MLTTVFSCSSDSNSDSNAGKQSIINNLKTHKWFTSSTIFEVDTEEFYASFDKDSRLVYFLTDTTGVNIYKGSGASTDGNSYKRLDYKYFKYEIQDDVVVMRNEDNTSDRMVYHKDFLEGKNGAHNLEALPLSHDSKFISEHAKLAHVHLLSSDERIKNIGKVEVTLLNTSSSGSKNMFNVQVTTKGEEYLLERQITSLRMYVKCSTYLYNTTTSETKVYGIVDNNKLSRTELYPIETSRSEIKLTINLSAYDAKNQKRYFLVESKEVTISKDGKVEVKDDESTGNNNSGNSNIDFTGTENNHEYVDLGLSVKWATINVGATKPEGYGSYYAWGETTTKTNYSWYTYKWCKGLSDTMTKYCKSVAYGTVDNKEALELADDVAHVKWGGSWRMPKSAEQEELLKNCDWVFATKNGIYGYNVTSKINGTSIFIPAAGYRDNEKIYDVGSSGTYWSSETYKGKNISQTLGFDSKDTYTSVEYRCVGFPVRAVCP